MATPGTGSLSYARYGFESTFNTSPGDGSLSTFFGHNVRFSATPRNNTERIPNLNTRNYSKYAAKKFEGSFTVDFQVSNWFFLKAIIGTVATTGAGPFTHTYTEADLPTSVTIQSSEDLDTDSERTFTGCVFDKFTCTMSTGDVLAGRIDGFYAQEAKDSTLNTTGNTSDSEEVFTFSQANLELPNATTQTEVQSLEMSITNNFEMIWGLGSRLATKRISKQRVYEFRLSKIRDLDADILDRFYGGTAALTDPGTPADTADLDILITNGESGTAERRFQALFDNIQVEDPSIPLNPTEVVKEDALLYALNLNGTSKAVYVNNDSSHP